MLQEKARIAAMRLRMSVSYYCLLEVEGVVTYVSYLIKFIGNCAGLLGRCIR